MYISIDRSREEGGDGRAKEPEGSRFRELHTDSNAKRNTQKEAKKKTYTATQQEAATETQNARDSNAIF
jgi:hypothetical protein